MINLVAKLESTCSYLDRINALLFSIYFINVQRNTFYVHDTKIVCFFKLNFTFSQNLPSFTIFPKILEIHISKYSFRFTPP